MFAFSGVLNRAPDEKRDPAFLEYAVSLAAGDGKKRVCFIPTATGDSPSAIEAVSEVFDGRAGRRLQRAHAVHAAQRARCRGVSDGAGRPAGREYVASGELPAGYATEDGVGLHYIGTELHEAVAMRDGAQAWWVEASPGGGYHDEPIRPRRL